VRGNGRQHNNDNDDEDEEGEIHPLVTLTKIDPSEIPEVQKTNKLSASPFETITN